MRSALLALVLALTALVLVDEPPRADVRQNPHEIFDEPPSDACQACHKDMPKAYASGTRHALVLGEDELLVDGTGMCEVCHTDEHMHMVGVEIDFPVPKDLLLDGEKKITCLTCHTAHGKLTSDRPWAAVSFMDKLMNDDDLHKSYLLRRKNSNGDLCLVCHDTKGEPKQ